MEKYSGTIPGDIKSFDEILGFLTDTRDGTDSPDIFYLGELPREAGKFCARLDSWHQMEVPADPAERRAFLAARRIGRISRDFSRDLHVRVFRAFASLGFDDIGWLPTEDLQLLVAAGEAELASFDAQITQMRLAKGKKEFEGKRFADKEIEKAQVDRAAFQEKLLPYSAELDRRVQ